MTHADTPDDTHAQDVPPEFIPEGYLAVTDYTEEDLPALAEDIAAGGDATTDEILETLEELVHGYNVPVVAAERSARIQYGEEEL